MVKEVGLYGGAISTVFPEGFLDASMLREVPDTQEVYVNNRRSGEHHGDGLGQNESIIVDLLERVSEASDEKAFEEHLEEITNWNGGKGMSMVRHETVDKGRLCCLVMESIDKWGKQEENQTVLLCVGLVRLAEYDTDATITINVPVEPAMSEELKELTKNQIPKRATDAYELLKSIVREFKVVDSSLFV